MKPVLLLKFPYTSRFGGGEQHTLKLCETLRQRGGRIYFLGSCSVLLEEFRRRRWPAQRWWMGKEPVSWWSLFLFPFTAVIALLGIVPVLVFYRLVKGVRTFYCLSLTEKLLLTPLLRLLGGTVIWVEHVEVTRWLTLNPYRVLYRWWSRLATILVIAKVIRDQLIAMGVPERHVTLVYIGVDLGPYPERPREMFHWDKRFVVGTVARLEAEKGIAFLLRAFQQFLAIVPHARLIVVGDGSERKKLEWLGRKLSLDRQVQWVGFQQNIPEWMKAFDCFVLPSVGRESFGIVLLEAMAAGCPVIASKIGGVPEIIMNNQTGILVEPAEPELLVQALVFLYRHPDIAAELGARGRARVARDFSLTQSLDRLVSLFP